MQRSSLDIIPWRLHTSSPAKKGTIEEDTHKYLNMSTVMGGLDLLQEAKAS